MKFLTAIMGMTKRNRIRNTHITEQFRMEDTENQIKGNRLKWFRHVKRMDKHRIPKRLPEMEITRERRRGRP
jgi:hypothetical protein